MFYFIDTGEIDNILFIVTDETGFVQLTDENDRAGTYYDERDWEYHDTIVVLPNNNSLK